MQLKNILLFKFANKGLYTSILHNSLSFTLLGSYYINN